MTNRQARTMSLTAIWAKAVNRALRSIASNVATEALARPGACIFDFQVASHLEPGESVRLLAKEGGLLRFYCGIGPSVVAAPLSRVLSVECTRVVRKVSCEWAWRPGRVWAPRLARLSRYLVLAPADTLSTVLQARNTLPERLLSLQLYAGLLPRLAADALEKVLWLLAWQSARVLWPVGEREDRGRRVVRHAVVSAVTSLVIDVVTAPLHALKVHQQTASPDFQDETGVLSFRDPTTGEDCSPLTDPKAAAVWWWEWWAQEGSAFWAKAASNLVSRVSHGALLAYWQSGLRRSLSTFDDVNCDEE